MRDQSQELLMTEVPEDDILQELELLKLQGIPKASRYIVERKLKYQNREYFFDDHSLLNIEGPAFAPPTFSAEVYDRLVDWALSQSPEIARLILEFLDEPSEEYLKQVLKILKKSELLAIDYETPSQSITLTQKILDFIEEQAVIVIEDLYEMARIFLYDSRRPEAAVRQVIRRLTTQGQIEQIEKGVYKSCQ